MSDIKEDLKILKEIIEHKNDYDFAFGTKIWRPYSLGREDIQAIENILNRLEQDERVIEEMAKYISNFDIDEPICDKKTGDCYADMYGVCEDCIIDHFRKKVEE